MSINITVTITKEMVEALEKERKRRMLDSVPEVVREIIMDYIAKVQTERE